MCFRIKEIKYKCNKEVNNFIEIFFSTVAYMKSL